MTTIHALTAEK